ncbi:E3 ubiquitin/ISG15 ligase TRIM25-like [Aquarana catesbeiana]|uniref:E3 ubiquitin/ISG15 ligase TRIM25-like n=1 Tax=Aquarana catesbeiana TaxID=8400 RepID=UPI003CC9DDA7
MASADLRKELECSICLNIYTDPVTLKCGHDFCRDCIERVLDTLEGSGGYSCPECREEFQDRSALRRNITLRNIAENFLSSHPDQKSGVFCTYCMHTSVPAVKSCLMCEAYLCDNHLRVHSKSPEHVLYDPTTSLENRKCSVHKELLKYYCTEDSTSICASCSLAGEHWGHQVETLDEASEMKKKKLRNVLQKLMTEKEEVEKRVQSLQERRRKVQGKADDETERVTALFRDLRRRLEDLENRVLSDISGQAERVSLPLSNMIQQLKIKKKELYRKMYYIEEMCNMTDPLTVLQESHIGDFCDTEDGDNDDRERHDKLLHDGGDLDVAVISHTLHTGLSDIMSGVNVQKCTGTEVYPHSRRKEKGHLNAETSRRCPQPSPTIQPPKRCPQPFSTIQPSRRCPQPFPTIQPSKRRPQPYPTIQHSRHQAGGPNTGAVQQTWEVSGVTDILLDVRTAGNDLHISDDGKTASFSSSHQNRPETPVRFHGPQVISSQRFSSGRHYWEVDVGGSEYWKVGMCYPSIDRRGGQSEIGCNRKSWCLERGWGNQYSVIHGREEIILPGNISSNRVRIDLDYEAGRISFYELCNPTRHLHTFTTTFTEPLHAGFYIGGNEGCIKISERNHRGITVECLMASADLRKELECSICLNIYTDPVTLKCGHNFCRDCIGRVLDTQEGSGSYSCPECREEFQDRSALRRNITLHNIVETFLSSTPDQEKSGVFCTQCIHTAVPAVISCLMCEASLCDNHLRVHSKSPEHVLCDLTTSMENRKCSVHKKILEYYCTEDFTCICVSCSLAGEHRGHQVETLDEASEMKKKKLRNVLQKLMTEREETEKRVQSLQEHRRKVQGKEDDETERVTALFRDLRRRLEDLEKRVLREISGQAERVSLPLSDMIQQLEIKKEELSKKMVDIEELCNMTDPLTVLQESNKGDLYYTKDGDDEDRERHDKLLHDGGDLDVAWISLTLHTGLSDILQPTSGVSEVTDILLDVRTAGNHLHISDDRKTASWSSHQNRPETPERFEYPQVMSSQRFSGRHYWEVDVGGSDMWRIGMCYPSIDRRGEQSRIGYNKKSWGLGRWGDNWYSVRHDRKEIQLLGNVSSNRVSMDLDYEAGRISFYELCDPIRHLHTFTTTFTEPLQVGLRVGKGCIKITGGKSNVRNLPRDW